MNEHLTKRFSKGRRAQQPESGFRAHDLLPPLRLSCSVRGYYERQSAVSGGWMSRPEVPTSEEVLDTDTIGGAASTSDIVELECNKLRGEFSSKEEYLSTHYELLREDTVRPIRDAVARVRKKPHAMEDEFDIPVGLYTNVHICAVTPSTHGIAVRVTFNLSRARKKILWEQSKRLISGSLVALTPKGDVFQKKAIVATVAARPLCNLLENPPEVDLFFARAEELEIDPAAEYVMVEERSGYLEARRHTLLALQHMMNESFPLSEHLVKIKSDVSAPPQHLLETPNKDLRPVLIENKHESYENVDILKGWPRMPQSEMDSSQLNALRSILTKRLAIIQGPPGTGKTFVSVQAIKVMLANRRIDDPPIIIACQTNHAIDQMLRHIAQFEDQFARLGGQSKDRDVIKKRTLGELRRQIPQKKAPGSCFSSAKKKMDDLRKEILLLLDPLKPNKMPLNHRVLEHCKLLTKKQADSLESGASRWVQDKKTQVVEAQMPFTVWLGDSIFPIQPKQLPEEFGFDYEEADLEFEQLREVEAENLTKDDEEFESLNGIPIPVADNFTCHNTPGMSAKVKELLKEQDMWKIPEASRGAIYCYLQAEQKAHILAQVRKKARQYDYQAHKRKIGSWEQDELILKDQRIIGMTTTGFSKYRALISALQPKIVLIEEAAETLEGPVAVTCVPSLQQLILIGDHQQLRPQTHIKAYQDEPYWLNVSLFERMVENKVHYEILSEQRRMKPEIRRLLYPIYKDKIKDHPSVLNSENRPDVPGLGGVNSMFFSHHWPEQRDDRMSCYNSMEAEMLVGFFAHLVYNGVDAEEITVLTFYNSQRKRILAELHKSNIPFLYARMFKVVTVDSYQGEENKVVILSLVRSNNKNQIGFLSVVNRVCVALSRAQCGFYIFGDGELLFNNSKTWRDVLMIMAGQKNKQDAPAFERNRLNAHLPIRCSKHGRILNLEKPEHWEGLVGGCRVSCGGMLPCGHPCELSCHPFPHDAGNCQKCRAKMPVVAATESENSLALSPSSKSHSETLNSTSTVSWHAFGSHQEPRRFEQTKNYEPLLKQQLLDVDTMEQSIRRIPALLDSTTESTSGPSDCTDKRTSYNTTDSISVASDLTIQPAINGIIHKKWKETYTVQEPVVVKRPTQVANAEIGDLIDLNI